ncbi:unnamed protein product, partial [Strongylus vulgaris]
MRRIQSNTCIRFKPRTNERDYVEIQNQAGQGCYTSVGRPGGKSVLMLEAGGFWFNSSFRKHMRTLLHGYMAVGGPPKIRFPVKEVILAACKTLCKVFHAPIEIRLGRQTEYRSVKFEYPFFRCMETQIVQHELLHVVGLWHEHMRYDRDKYIKVHYE